MKKILIFLVTALFAVCLVPLAACGESEQPKGERKRIIGIDSDKTYLKSKIHLANHLDLIGKELVFEILSYDRIKEDELQGVDFEFNSSGKYELTAERFELSEKGYNDREGYYDYFVTINTYMRWSGYEVSITSVTLKIDGQDYKFKTDILCVVDFEQPVFVQPDIYGFNMVNGFKSVPYGLLISTRYDMTLKSLKFQTEGFEILSYEVETYTAPQTGTGEFISGELPIKLKAEESYQINVEAIPPQDCLYYGYGFEAIVEIGGVEMTYNNVNTINDGIRFLGSALNALNELKAV